ncbi:MAG: mechanosensitive ion channel family protein [Acidobacteria bacterium]|nr:mechanosensitive ion channel family protein [Acidobacteriota bacterium]
MVREFSIIQWIVPLGLILGGMLIGLFVNKFVLGRLRKAVGRTRWNGDEFVVTALGGMPILWLTLLGVYAALQSLPSGTPWLNFGKNALLVIAILSVTIFVANISAGLVGLYARRLEGTLPATSLFTNLTRLLVFLIGALIILQTLNVSITPILTALGVGGLAVALALQDTLSNLFSGLQIIASRQVRPGDYVKLESDEEGYVTDITWRNTAIRALPNNMVIVPNSKLASTLVTNYYQPEKEMAVLVQVGVSYQSDLKKVEQITIDVAREVMREVEGGVPEFKPFIRYYTFGDSSINFTVILRGREFTDQFLIKHEFIKQLHERYQHEGIEIPFPIRTIQFMKER